MQQTADSQFIVAGYSASANGNVASNHGDSDYWIVKLGDKAAPGLGDQNFLTSPRLLCIPNPATNTLLVIATENINQLTISDISGRIVYSGQYGTNEILIEISSLPPGMYLVSVNGLGAKRFVKQ